MPVEEYFDRVAEQVFGDALIALGANKVRTNPRGPWSPLCVRFESTSWFVELVVLLEDGPRYSPRVHIGPLPELEFNKLGRNLDIMHCVPEGSPRFLEARVRLASAGPR